MIFGFWKKRFSTQGVMDSSKLPTKFLTFAYVFALSFIALLAWGSHMIIIQMTTAQKEISEISYIVGRQRVTAQQVALYSTEYFKTRNESDKVRLENAYFSFKIGHEYLIQGFDPEKTKSDDKFQRMEGHKQEINMSPELYKIYFKQPIDLHRQSKEYMELVEKMLELDMGVYGADKVLERTQGRIVKKAIGTLLLGLDLAAQQYQAEAQDKIGRLNQMQTIVFVGMILTLILEALFIFGPLVANVRKYSQELLHMALKDALTGLNNRRAFMQLGENELSRARRHKGKLCVVLSDIDKFKSVNDTYGHDVGDQVLIHLAQLLKNTIRKEDIVGRIGGEEFAFVLPETSDKHGMKLIEKLRKKIENTPCMVTKDDGSRMELKYTSSFGVAYFSDHSESVSDMLKRADIALYEAKEAGRNTVIFAKSPKDEPLKVVTDSVSE